MMISVEEAKKLLHSSVVRLPSVLLPLEETSGMVLAEDVCSPVDLPLFDQSAMDGFAVSDDGHGARQFTLVGEIKAGDDPQFQLKNGQAAAVYTGAAIPEGTTGIAIQENVERESKRITLKEEIKTGHHIRKRGTQIRQDELALPALSVLNPASVGFLASLGIEHVRVFRKPVVSILTTGNEIIAPGQSLLPGQQFECNSFSLRSALQAMNIDSISVSTVRDDAGRLKEAIERKLEPSDVIILTGGVSVGQYDLVPDALRALQVETIFYKVKQRPGKPVFAGRLGSNLIFALPGNPASALVCFYEYIFPAVRKMQGFAQTELQAMQMKVIHPVEAPPDRDCFIRSKTMNGEVEPFGKQDSNVLRSFAESDALIYIPAGKKIQRGEHAEVHLLPFNPL